MSAEEKKMASRLQVDISFQSAFLKRFIFIYLRKILRDVHQQPVSEQFALDCYSRRNIARYYCCYYESQTFLDLDDEDAENGPWQLHKCKLRFLEVQNCNLDCELIDAELVYESFAETESQH